MRPPFHHELAMARIADLHHHAARERTVKAASRARRPQAHHRTRSVPDHGVTGLARRALTPARGRSPAPTR
jgi:hypothetical protein